MDPITTVVMAIIGAIDKGFSAFDGLPPESKGKLVDDMLNDKAIWNKRWETIEGGIGKAFKAIGGFR